MSPHVYIISVFKYLIQAPVRQVLQKNRVLKFTLIECNKRVKKVLMIKAFNSFAESGHRKLGCSLCKLI